MFDCSEVFVDKLNLLKFIYTIIANLLYCMVGRPVKYGGGIWIKQEKVSIGIWSSRV